MNKDLIDRVKRAARIGDLVSERVQLKKSGKGWMGRCPFHEEKTASFSVRPDKGRYKCFGCGQSGDAISWVMYFEKVTFIEAVRRVGRRFGVDAGHPSKNTTKHRPDPSKRKSLADLRAEYAANAKGAKWSSRKAFTEFYAAIQSEVDRIIGSDRDMYASVMAELDDQCDEFKNTCDRDEVNEDEFWRKGAAFSELAIELARDRLARKERDW